MGIALLVEISMQLSFDTDSIAQIISGMTSEDFCNFCEGVRHLLTGYAVVKVSSKRKSV